MGGPGFGPTQIGSDVEDCHLPGIFQDKGGKATTACAGQQRPALRDMGLLNIVLTTLGILTVFGLYAAYRGDRDEPVVILAAVIGVMGRVFSSPPTGPSRCWP